MQTLPPLPRWPWFVLAALWCLGGLARAQNVPFHQTSAPAGIVDQTSFPLPGATVTTVTAPETSAGYRFAFWTVNGSRVADPSGFAGNPVTFVLSGPTDAVAKYVPEGNDTDNDGLPDWWELRYFGNLAQDASGNPDGDGRDNAWEYANGTSPVLADEFMPGGISRRRGDVLNVAVGIASDPSYAYGGVSRRRSESVLVLNNPANYAVLRETSSVVGAVSKTRVLVKGSTVDLSDAPDPYLEYRFTGWLVNGTRLDSPTQLRPIPITVLGDTNAVARYLPESADTDGDGLPDWLEWLLFNSLQYDSGSDPDGDGLNLAFELARGYSTLAADELDSGGISRRRSATTTVDLTSRLPYHLASDPPGILDQTQYLEAGTTVTVADRKGNTYANFLFAWWDLNGARQQDPSGAALTGFQFTITAPSTATAHYLDPNVDSIGDGITDWIKLTYYNSLSFGADSDTDGDGFTFAQELLRGYSPRVRDTLDQGGVSRRRSASAPVNTGTLNQPPAVGSVIAVNVTPSSARLTATVNPARVATAAYFQWGLSTSYSQQTEVQPLGSGAQAILVSADLGGLSANTLYHFRVIATNDQGTTTSDDHIFQTSVQSGPVDPPVVTSPLIATGIAGVAFGYQITATNHPTNYGATGLPEGLSVNPATGLISGIPLVSGTYSLGVTAGNSGGLGGKSVTLTILPAPPVIGGTLVALGTQGVSFTYQISATNSPTSYGATGLPAGLSVNTTSGLISGTPNVSGNFRVGISATNAGGTGGNVLALNIPPSAPEITSALSAVGATGVAFVYQITASNNPTSYGATVLPSGLSVNPTTGLISGTPVQTGAYSVTIAAQNSGGTGSAILALNVTAPLPVDLQVASLTVDPPTAIQSGANLVIHWADANTGTSPTMSSFHDFLTVRNTTTGATLFSQTFFYDQNTSGNGPIGGGESRARQLSVHLPDGPAGVGNLEFSVTADSAFAIPESGAADAESNNTSKVARSSTLAPYPDLQVASLAVQPVTGSNIGPGVALTIRWNDSNTGQRSVASAFEDRVRVHNATTGQTLADATVPYDLVQDGGEIVPGTNRPRSFNLTLPSGQAGIGDLQITVNADRGQVISEYNATGTGESNNAGTLTVRSAPDTDGPTLSNWTYGSAAFADGLTVTQSAHFGVTASTPNGVSRVEFYSRPAGEADTLIGTDSSGGSIRRAFWNADATAADGDYTITIKAYDSFGNVTTESRGVHLALAPPPAPAIVTPAEGAIVPQVTIVVTGTGLPNAQVALYRNGSLQSPPATVLASGSFTKTLDLVDGPNLLQAAQTNRAGEGPRVGVTVTLDQSVPPAPSGLLAVAQAGGAIQLSWTRPPGTVSGYHLYRAGSPFDDPAQATRVNSALIAASTYLDSTPADGVYYYRVVSVNAAGSESAPSASASATSDRVLPAAASITLVAQGKYDAATARFGVGLVQVTLDATEELGSIPFLSFTPQGGAPLSVALQAGGNRRYTGSFTIADSTPSGTANATVSMRDLAGNRGVDIGSGGSLAIDTVGPRIDTLAVQPGSSIKNNPAVPKTVTFTAHFDSLPKAGAAPQFFSRLTNSAPTPAAVTSVARGGDDLTWIATLALPPTAGQTIEYLELSFSVVDDLDNVGTTIVPPHSFQVYSGDLPGLDSPLALTAKAKPAGRIELSWHSVAGAADYQIYRRVSGPGALVPLSLSAGALTAIDLPALDGVYDYTVAAIRVENGETSVGTQSNVATATSDRVLPPPPVGLTLQVISQGVKAQWQAAPGGLETVTYRLYRSRSDAADPQVAGESLSQLIAVDPSPDPGHPSYYVTALDAAGNESVPSSRVYQNVALLPVQTLEVFLAEGALPVLTWSQVSGNVAGYDVYQGPDNQRTKLNAAGLLTVTNFTDSGYSPAVDRIYTVVTVDGNGAASLGRSLTLPRLSATLAAGTTINRGVMNRFNFTVTNASPSVVNNAQLRVFAGGKNHLSERFSVPAGGTVTVPVIVGGYATLSGTLASVQTTIEIVPAEGEKVSIVRTSQVPVGAGQLRLDLIPGDFVRGGAGAVQFRLTNTSSEEIEITTGAGNGSQPSPEIRFTLLDGDGNALAVQPLMAVTGNAVVTLPNGRSVARLAAGAEYLSPERSLDVPLGAPANLVAKVEIDAIYYHQGRPDEVMLTGLQSRRDVVAGQTTYTGEVTSVTPAESNGDQNIAITGQARVRAGGQPAPNARLRVYVAKDGFERSAEVITDSGGQFTYNFHPPAGEGGGIYGVWAVHPDLTARQVQKSFVIRRVLVTPGEIPVRIPRQYAQVVPLTATAGEGVTVHNLRLQYLAEDQIGGTLPVGVTVVPAPALSTLAPGQLAPLTATLSGSSSAADKLDVVLRASSDESGGSGWQKVTLHVEFGDANPYLRTTPGFVTTGITPGGAVTETVTFENVGLAAAEGLTFSLLSQNGSIAPNWVSLSTAGVSDLPVGGSRPVSLVFQPSASVAESDYFFILRAQGSNLPAFDVNVHIAVTAAGEGGIVFKVRDPFTGTLDANGTLIQGLAGARIELQNELVVSVQQTLTTDAFGEAVAGSLPAGSYRYRVNAEKHTTASGRLWVRPGVNVNQEIDIQYNPVTIEFEVVPVTVEDRYHLVLHTTYETNVPMPVVVIDPPVLNIPKMCQGDVFNGEFTVTNYGLIRADDVQVQLPQSNENFKVEVLNNAPSHLAAGEVFRVAYRLTALADFGGNCNPTAAEGKASATGVKVVHPGPGNEALFAGANSQESLTLAPIGSGNPCKTVLLQVGVAYIYICPNGILYKVRVPFFIYGQVGECGGSAGGGGPLGPGTGGGGGNGGGGIIYGPVAVSNEGPCGHWEIFWNPRQGPKDPKKTRIPVGCAVDAMSRRYEDDIMDLEVPIPGRSGAAVSVTRRLRGQNWSMFDPLLATEGGKIVTKSCPPTRFAVVSGSDFSARWVPGPAGSVSHVGLPPCTETVTDDPNNPPQFFWKGARVDQPIKGFVFSRLPNGVGYRLTEPDGFWTNFDSSLYVSATGRNDLTYTTTIFDDKHRPFQVTDGQQILLTYEWANAFLDLSGPVVLKSIQDVSGRRVEYTYTGTQLTSVKGPEGTVTYYEYDATGNITKVTDPTGKSHTIAYRGDTVRSVLDDEGKGKTFDYSLNSSTGEYYVGIRSTSGVLEEMTFDSLGQPLENRVNGLLREKRVYTGATSIDITDAESRHWREDYNEWQLLSKRTLPDGSVQTFTYDPGSQLFNGYTDENGVSSIESHDSRRNPAQMVWASGTAVERRVQVAYDGADRPTQITWLADANTVEAKHILTYDAQGNLLSSADPLGHVRSILGRTALSSVTSLRDENGKVWNYGYDARNRLNAVTDADNHTVAFAFDEFSNLTSLTAPSGREITCAYDINNSLVSLRDPGGETQQLQYDSGGRLSRSIDRSGNSITYEYDSLSRLAGTQDGSGNRITYAYLQGSATADPATIYFPTFARNVTYNHRHQPLAVTDTLPGGAVLTTQYEYSPTGALKSVLDPANHATTFGHDALDRVTSVAREGVGTSHFTYDRNGHVVAFINPNGQSWFYSYDAAGRIFEERTPLGKKTTFVYDALGNLTGVTKPDGSRLVRSFDVQRRVTSVEYYPPGSTTFSKRENIVRDEDGRSTGWDNGTTRGSLTFDAVGRLRTELVDYGTFSSGIFYTYRPNGQLETYTSPSGAVTTYTYDTANRLVGTSVTGVGEFSVTKYQFDLALEKGYPGGTKRTYMRDGYQRPTAIKATDPAGSKVIDLTRGYDSAGNVFSVNNGAGSVSLTYDSGDRLQQGVSSNYTLDANGNRLTDTVAGGGTRHYDADDRLTDDGNNTYIYDENGALIRKVTPGGTWNFTYDSAGYLATISGPSGNTEYGYDPAGRRLFKKANGVVTYFRYCEVGLCAEYDGAGILLREYGYAGDAVLGDAPLYVRTGGQVYFYHADQLGTPLRLTDLSGAVVWTANYEDFGEAHVVVGLVENNIRFPGQYFDAESGLHYNWLRYYDPKVGRFLTKDPARDGTNYYIYAANNPLVFIDPTGERPDGTDGHGNTLNPSRVDKVASLFGRCCGPGYDCSDQSNPRRNDPGYQNQMCVAHDEGLHNLKDKSYDDFSDPGVIWQHAKLGFGSTNPFFNVLFTGFATYGSGLWLWNQASNAITPSRSKK